MKKNLITTLVVSAAGLIFNAQTVKAHTSSVDYTEQSSVQTPSNSAVASLDASINQLLEENQLPGLVLMVKHKGELIHFDAYGKVNRDEPKKMSKDAIFRIFSMSKPITAFALLQLVDQKLISLDDDIRQYLPEFSPFEVDGKEQVVTIHHLLSHTAGFGYGGGLKNWVDFRYLIANPLSRSNTLDDLVDDLSGIDLKFAPGERFEYSISSDIQGAIIEKVTAMPLDAYLSKQIFQPLEMVNTSFSVPQNQQERLVDMYEYDAGTFENALTFNKDNILFVETGKGSEYLEKPTLLSGGGGLVSTASDYSNFVSMLNNNGTYKGQRLMSENVLGKMLSSKTTGLDTQFLPRIYNNVGFGYGVAIKESEGDMRKQGSFFWSGLGGTTFWADPKSDLTVVAMMQVEDGWIALEKWLIPHVYKLIEDKS